jgi:PAS domain S-box-containing protein
MNTAPQLSDPTRLAALRATELLDGPPQESFDRLTQLATRLLSVPIATVSLVDESRQFFVACIGVDEPWASERGTPLSYSFCQYVVATREPLIVEDSRKEPLLTGNLAISELGIIAYAGIPLVTTSGHVLGSFCAMDTIPRKWRESDISALETLAAATMNEIEVRASARALVASEARFRQTLENVRAGAVILDVDGHVVFANDYFLEVIGRSAHEVLGADWFDLTTPDAAEQAVQRARFRASIIAGYVTPSNERTVRTASGEQRLLVWGNTIIRNTDGTVTGMAGIAQDVTAEREAARLKNELIGVVSHELRNPLTSIRGAIRLVAARMGNEEPKLKELVDVASRNSDRMLRLVNDLLDVERVTSGSVPLSRESLSVFDVMTEARDAVATSALEKNLVFEVEPSDATVDADHDRIVQVLANLIGNAIKFSPANARILISAVADPSRTVTFSVHDHGRGVPVEARERIFERFGQVEAGDAKAHGGAGLGLAICKAIVELHGGRIWVDTPPGDGSIFRFTIPPRA